MSATLHLRSFIPVRERSMRLLELLLYSAETGKVVTYSELCKVLNWEYKTVVARMSDVRPTLLAAGYRIQVRQNQGYIVSKRNGPYPYEH
jgi:hypothetical protein